jgi:putative flippase GtrA
VLTTFGAQPKVAMTLLYVLGTLQSFMFNKRWSFRSEAPHGAELARYVASYAAGYLLNLLLLVVLVDRMHLPHRLVQAFAIVALAVFLFVLQKFWVFRVRHGTVTESTP